MTTSLQSPVCFLLVLLAFSFAARGASYALTDNWVGPNFLQAFSWQAISDPTHGRVNYLSQSSSLSLNLTYASSNRFILKADSTNTLSASGPGRNSNRIMSNKKFGHNTVLVADVNHMPVGCATWPALWSTDIPSWPNLGEIDIIEGVNNISPNAMSLHTTATCTIPPSAAALGRVTNTDCNWQVNGNTGCGFLAPGSNTYGPAFNNADGGWYAMERTPTFIKVWFWSRKDSGVPSEVRTLGQSQINTNNWGTPTALFANNNCDISSKFGAHNIIINLTFCGDWAGGVYTSNGCPGNCVDYVNNNPAAFRDAFWDINAVRMYGA